MSFFFSANAFPVNGRTILITGASRGTGLEAGRQLAEKGASVVIVARDEQRLREGVEYMRAGLNASSSEHQRFHHISADLTSPAEAARVVAEATAWNDGAPPDVVWCTAGVSHPSLFVDTEVDKFRDMMDGNYFSSVYMAHAILRAWLRPEKGAIDEYHDDDDEDEVKKGSETPPSSSSSPPSRPAAVAAAATAHKPTPRHLIFTASFLAFYPVAGYAPYNPSKAALRSMSDTLSQEMELYAAAHPGRAPVKVHTVFPATILTESYEAENRIKPDVTKMLEGPDGGQTPAEVARAAIAGLEAGHEIITTELMTRFVSCGMLGTSVRGGFWKGLVDYLMGCVGLFALVIVRWTMDNQVRQWGRLHGDSGMKSK
ncbi:hypothetical protein Daus18300_012242 [Diaporthe australafricana]|uniref:3-dehydrosphinganine reductase n=1 Tax=Diaporthe australafricana TaxID=127596 RepID=A0ABR3W3E2_9PEZI